jgi:hypothetical protein
MARRQVSLFDEIDDLQDQINFLHQEMKKQKELDKIPF